MPKNRDRRDFIRKRKPKQSLDGLPLPSEEKIGDLARVVAQRIHRETLREKYAPVKHVLTLLGAGAVLGLSFFVSPTAAVLAKPFLDERQRRDWDEWKRYNRSYLKRTIRRLQKEKLVTITQQGSEQVITLTKNGKRRIFRYSLEELTIEKSKTWDGLWRLVLYDVATSKRALRDVFREALRSLGFYQLQESVWLYPYPCEPQVSFLREYFGVGNEVIYLVATKLEDDTPYRTYFDV